MKKTVLALIIATAGIISSDASQICWANSAEIYDWSEAGNLLPETCTSCIIRLYESADDTINFGLAGGTAATSADDVWTGIQFHWASGGDHGFGAADLLDADTAFGIDEGDKIYSVIFSISTTNGFFAIVDNSLATVAYTTGSMTYDAGGVAGGLQASGGDWQPIPEPATAMLLTIGGGLVCLMRLKQQLG